MSLTKLPFVYAAWALRRGVENKALRRELRDAKRFGMETLDGIIETRSEYDEAFRRDYLGWHIHYHLAEDEKNGIAKFCELPAKTQPRPSVRAQVYFVIFLQKQTERTEKKTGINLSAASVFSCSTCR
ncbi:MAG: MqnA/MqnD/SBP family protein [Limisphaerales bacterium]